LATRNIAAVRAKLVPDAATLYGKAELVVKVKEPVDGDLPHLRADHRLFCFLHLAAEPALTRRLLDIGLTAVGFETVEENDGSLPLLAPHEPDRRQPCCADRCPPVAPIPGRQGRIVRRAAGSAPGSRGRAGFGRSRRQCGQAGCQHGARVTAFDKRMDRMSA
jgi:alanine dehydrogenase